MARRDLTIYSEAGFGTPGSKIVNVAAGATAILAGEPVLRALGGATGTQMGTNKPVVATDFLEGIAVTDSTQTASVAGTVEVIPLTNTVSWLITPNSSTAFDTQAEYDALVGDRVLMDLTSGTFTLLATDGATNGCVIEPLDISKYPGKVRISFRAGVSTLA